MLCIKKNKKDLAMLYLYAGPWFWTLQLQHSVVMFKITDKHSIKSTYYLFFKCISKPDITHVNRRIRRQIMCTHILWQLMRICAKCRWVVITTKQMFQPNFVQTMINVSMCHMIYWSIKTCHSPELLEITEKLILGIIFTLFLRRLAFA